MKSVALFVSLLFTAGLALAQSAKAAPAQAKEKTHQVTAEVVSADAAAKTLTIKGEKGNQTMPCEGAAVASLKTVKAGEKVELTCRDNEKGEHQAVTAIKPAKKAT
jgi:Cu/Ag efflux protein CusF